MTGIEVWEATTPAARAQSLQIRHDLFCLGRAGQVFENCQALRPDAAHDHYDVDETLQFYGMYNGAPVAAARLVVGPDLPTAEAYLKLGWPLPDDLADWAEPSRLGLDEDLQRTRLGKQVYLRLVGTVIESSLVHGRRYWLLTIREQLFRALRWFPFRLDQPFLYPGGSGGPETVEPIFPTTLCVPEIVIASWYQQREAYHIMFPNRPTLADWGDLITGADIRSVEQLAALAAGNRRTIQAHMAAWKSGSAKLPTVGG
jgi:hypothetical protein